MLSPNVCILKTDGINGDAEMAHAFTVAGAQPETVHINQLREGGNHLDRYDILALSGGFSYGDDIASGFVLANELTARLGDQLQGFLDRDKPVLGVCNGFQTLVRTGLLPDRKLFTRPADEQRVTLNTNEIARFDRRWVDLHVGESACRFLGPEDVEGHTMPAQTAHGEGLFNTDPVSLTLLKNKQVVVRYARSDGSRAEGFPDNPNGSVDNIAGICDPTGTILGMMPHPERSVTAFHPDRRRRAATRTLANRLFRNIVNYAKEL